MREKLLKNTKQFHVISLGLERKQGRGASLLDEQHLPTPIRETIPHGWERWLEKCPQQVTDGRVAK